MNLLRKVTQLILSKKKSLIICFISVAIITTFIIAITKADGSSNVSATEKDTPIAEESSAIGQSSSQSYNSSDTDISQTSSTGITGCIHNYTTVVVEPTCTEQGYTLHTCKKCGESNRDSFIAPRHTYGKYLCEYCGLPDPERSTYSLFAWLSINGTLADNGAYSSIDYEENGTNYSISTNIYAGGIAFDFENSEEHFRIFLYDDTERCSMSYWKNKIMGRTEQNNSEVCSSLSIKLDEFENNGDIVCTEEEYTTQMISKIDGFLYIIQDKLLYPRTGLKLEDFGFTAY